MYSRSYYKRRKVGGTISNVIFRIIMFIVAACLVGVVVWAVGKCFTQVDSEIQNRQYVP